MKGMNIIKDPVSRFKFLNAHGYYDKLSDEDFLKKKFELMLGYPLNLEDPKTLNEKLNWLKINDHKEIYIRIVDKCEVKKYITETIGEDIVVPTLGVWGNFDDIDFNVLPEKFVLKCTHDSGGLFICKDKNEFNAQSAKRKIEQSLRTNFYKVSREWPYQFVQPRIIAEPYLVDESGWELKDYKIFCINGHAEYVEVDFNRFIKHKLNPYDFDWNPLNFCDKSKNDYEAKIPRPKRLDDMKRIAEILSSISDFMRVDFYSIDDQIYIGELTLYPGGGFIQYEPADRDLYYGGKLKLTGFKKS